MTTAKKSSKSSKTNASHATNEGDETMKTTTKSHATSANHATNEGETTMKTTKAAHIETTLSPIAAPEAASIPATIAATPSATPVTMPTTSPSVAATLAYIQSCTVLMDRLEAAFPQGTTLTAKDKKHTAKARKGSERYTPQLVALAKQHGVNLSLVPLDTISNASAEATALVPLQKRIEAMSTRASSRMFALQSTSWSGSAKLYSVLKRLSKDSGDIESGLAPVEQYFNHRHPLVAKEHPKTKKGKAALAAKEPAAGAGAMPVVAPVAAPVAAPAATPANGAAHS
jgi:hypothetical protein